MIKNGAFEMNLLLDFICFAARTVSRPAREPMARGFNSTMPWAITRFEVIAVCRPLELLNEESIADLRKKSERPHSVAMVAIDAEPLCSNSSSEICAILYGYGCKANLDRMRERGEFGIPIFQSGR